jgi:hypothetical protein
MIAFSGNTVENTIIVCVLKKLKSSVNLEV